MSCRQYAVPAPNSLWHIDGHHSLIRWRMVIDGGVDGLPRMIICMKCYTNNRASTVLSLLLDAVQLHGWPSENVEVARAMLH